MAINKALVFTITSVKGGVGKSIFTINLANTLKNLNKRVLIIDLDLYGGSIATILSLDIKNDFYKLVEDLNNNKFSNFDDYVAKYDENLDVLPSLIDPRNVAKINAKYVSVILNKAIMKYDVILLDTNHILNEINLLAMDLSDEILYILSNDPLDLKNMKTMISIHKNMEMSNYKIILNEAINKNKSMFTKLDIKSIIKDNVDFILPNSLYYKNIDRIIMNGNIMGVIAKNKELNKKYTMIANTILKNSNKKEVSGNAE